MCIHVCLGGGGYGHVSIDAHWGQKMILNLQVLEWWVIVDHPMWVLGTEHCVLLECLLTISITSIHFTWQRLLRRSGPRGGGGVVWCYMTYKDGNGVNYLKKKMVIELSKLWVMTNIEKEALLKREGSRTWRNSLERKGEGRTLISHIWHQESHLFNLPGDEVIVQISLCVKWQNWTKWPQSIVLLMYNIVTFLSHLEKADLYSL